jgi:hypothetical protein
MCSEPYGLRYQFSRVCTAKSSRNWRVQPNRDVLKPGTPFMTDASTPAAPGKHHDSTKVSSGFPSGLASGTAQLLPDRYPDAAKQGIYPFFRAVA